MKSFKKLEEELLKQRAMAIAESAIEENTVPEYLGDVVAKIKGEFHDRQFRKALTAFHEYLSYGKDYDWALEYAADEYNLDKHELEGYIDDFDGKYGITTDMLRKTHPRKYVPGG